MKKIAITQSNYIPWKGYFDLIAFVDEFILYDDVQYTKRDWRSRNKIKTPRGEQWLSVPIQVKGKYIQKINESAIDGNKWQKRHWNLIYENYKRARYFDEIATWLKPIYLDKHYVNLSQMNVKFIDAVCKYLSINTKISQSTDYKCSGDRVERLVNICMQAAGTHYVSGESARNYLDEEQFNENNLNVIWFNYKGYSDYPQLWGKFTHGVTILDLLFNCGKNSSNFMRYVSL